MIDALSALFSSVPLVKVLRLFLMNPDHPYDRDDIIERCKITKEQLATELKILNRISFLKKKNFTKTVIVSAGTKTKEAVTKTKKTSGWVLNEKFPFVEPLRNLLIESELIEASELARKFKKAGRIKLLALSGIFMQRDDLPVDMLIVGDHLARPKIEKLMRDVESEIGKELRYAVFEGDEFRYRLNMFDKLLLDVFNNPHEKVVNQIEFLLPR